MRITTSFLRKRVNSRAQGSGAADKGACFHQEDLTRLANLAHDHEVIKYSPEKGYHTDRLEYDAVAGDFRENRAARRIGEYGCLP